MLNKWCLRIDALGFYPVKYAHLIIIKQCYKRNMNSLRGMASLKNNTIPSLCTLLGSNK